MAGDVCGMIGIGLESISTGRAFGPGRGLHSISLSLFLDGLGPLSFSSSIYVFVDIQFLLLLTASIRQERRCVA